MKITRLGHAAILVEGSKTIIIDPFITDNPVASHTLDQIPPTDLILVSHDHFDHLGDAIALAQRDGAQLVGLVELTKRQDIESANIKTVGFNIGGTVEFDDVAITLTAAVHSSEVGVPTGFIIKIDGKTLYHSGDTEVFSDMALIAELYGHIDVAMLPIGGFYTMDIHGAKRAVELLKPQTVIPIHYNTWPAIEADAEAFKQIAGNYAEIAILNPGQSYA